MFLDFFFFSFFFKDLHIEVTSSHLFGSLPGCWLVLESSGISPESLGFSTMDVPEFTPDLLTVKLPCEVDVDKEFVSLFWINPTPQSGLNVVFHIDLGKITN